MDWEELKPKSKAAVSIGDDLKSLSLAELEERILALTGEIERVRGEIARKKAHNSAAEDLFKR